MSASTSRRSPFRLAAVLLALAGAVLLGGVVVQSQTGAVRFYQPAGYLAQVRALVQDGLITYDKKKCDDQPASRTMRPCFHRSKASPEVIEFHDTSYLKEDLRLLQSGEVGTFYIEDGKLQVSERDRRLRLPFADRRQSWEGKLEFREGGPSALLENETATFRILQPQRSQLPLKPEQHKPISAVAPGTSRSAYAFDWTDPGQLGSFASVEFVGDDVVLTVDRRSPEVKVNGQRIPVGTRVRLEDGDVLILEKPGLERVFYFRNSSARDVVSRSRELNGQIVRSETPGSFPLARNLVDGISGVVAASPAESKRTFDVRLTIERELHEAVQTKLEEYIEKHGGRPAPAAVTLLDAQTGEALALGSYPPPRLIERFVLAGADVDADRLALNQNLLLHPIGSTIKPFLAAALWQVAPQLAELKIRPHYDDEVSEVLGLTFDKPLRTLVHDQATRGDAKDVYVEDRRAFFKHSCNLYLANLFLLALAVPPDSPEPVWTDKPLKEKQRVRIGSQVVQQVPDVSYFLHGDRVDHLEAHPFAEALQEAFEIDVLARESTDPSWNTAARYDLGPLRDLLAALEIGPTEIGQARPLYVATPERVNLRLNQVQTFRAQLISFLAGGASAEWSNLKLAEGMARLGTGRAVRAKLVRSVRKGNREQSSRAEEPPVLSLEPTALQWVRDGLLLPAQPGGTAGALAPALKRWEAQLAKTLGRKDVQLLFYSKTGTPRKKDVGPDSGAYIFYLGLVAGGELLSAVSGSVYIEDRGGSTLAVQLAEDVLEEVIAYLPRHQK